MATDFPSARENQNGFFDPSQPQNITASWTYQVGDGHHLIAFTGADVVSSEGLFGLVNKSFVPDNVFIQHRFATSGGTQASGGGYTQINTATGQVSSVISIASNSNGGDSWFNSVQANGFNNAQLPNDVMRLFSNNNYADEAAINAVFLAAGYFPMNGDMASFDGVGICVYRTGAWYRANGVTPLVMKVGTFISPPIGLLSGEQWLDTTGGGTVDAIVRQHI